MKKLIHELESYRTLRNYIESVEGEYYTATFFLPTLKTSS